ncbi:hypothetical protein [Streptomyces camelliae]|uniref:Alpha/beta hydrolase n=1 Tax=Streptomyces camelliae TaxID=3004093 RepID=A0ABY7PKN6_9ACTN|nr:hypothetical protein [Streptomyces sp. HUAS 2-6]WBO69528.1 hypothetical protein O1G22_39475 [Streptomyces sp. HUAS 2-6]
MQPVFVLAHSPSVGTSTRCPVAAHLAGGGTPGTGAVVAAHRRRRAALPAPRFVDAVCDDLRQVPADSTVRLVAHSNAGLFVPVIGVGLGHPVSGSVFVDAALPAGAGPTPVASPELLHFLRPLAVHGRLPSWTDWWEKADVAPAA